MSKKEKAKEQSHRESHKPASFEGNGHIDSSHTDSHQDHSSPGASYQEAYLFSVSNDAVTSVAEVERGVAKTTFVKPYETYSVNGTDVLKTEGNGIFREISRYSDNDADGAFQKIAETEVLNVTSATNILQLQNALARGDHMKFSLDASGRIVTASHVLQNGAVINETLPAATAFSVHSGFVVESETKGGATHWEVFRDGNGDGVYTEVAHGNGPLADLVGLASNLATTADSLL